MITPTMSALEAAQDARKDLRAIVHKIQDLSKVLERQHRKLRDRKALLENHLSWRSPRGNNWLLVLRANKKETTVSSLVWYRGRDEKLRAVYLSLLNAQCVAISAHMLERYMERFDPGRDPIKRLQDFFFANHDMSFRSVSDLGGGCYEVMVGLAHGMATGVYDTNTQLTTLTTFLDHGLLGKEQQDLAEYLDFQRELMAYPKGYRAHIQRMIDARVGKAA